MHLIGSGMISIAISYKWMSEKHTHISSYRKTRSVYPVSMPWFNKDWMPDKCSAFSGMTAGVICTGIPETHAVRYPLSISPFRQDWMPDKCSAFSGVTDGVICTGIPETHAVRYPVSMTGLGIDWMPDNAFGVSGMTGTEITIHQPLPSVLQLRPT